MKTDRQSPISEYLLKLQLIVSNTEFKNKEEASKYETVAMTREADIYIHAVNQTDIFDLYQYTEQYVYDTLINYGYDGDDILRLIEHPHMIPQNIKNYMMLTAREKCLNTYEEKNKYYRSLTGKPFVSSTDTSLNDPIVCIPDEFYNRYKSDPNIEYSMPVHELPVKYQELYMNSKYYQEALEKYPNVMYLKFIGSNAIPVEVSRKTRDGDIMKINTDKLTTYHQTYGCITVSSDIVHKFTQVYKETRDYVYNTLRGEFQDIYPNYNSLIRFLTIYMAIGNCMNEFMKNSTTLLHMNNASANNLFNLYGLPSVIMEGNSMIDFLKKFRLLLMDKGTNTVYRVKDLIGYEYTDIYSLVMVKQQVFHNGKPLYAYDPETGEAIPKQRIVFRRIGTSDENTSYFKFKESNVEYLERRFPADADETEEEYQISSGDPRWWESKEVVDALRNMNYTLSNSKYIQLSTHLSLTDIWFQSVILLRALLDNRLETEFTKININFNVNGSSEISVFDAVLCLIIIMNWQLGLSGNMYVDNNPFDGEAGVLDLLFNGIYQGRMYKYRTKYYKNDVVGIPGDDTLYLVLKDFTTLGPIEDVPITDFVAEDVRKLRLKEITEYTNMEPKQRVYGNKFKIASFDFDLKNTKPDYYNSIQYQSYLEPATFLPMLDSVLDRQTTNVGETVMVDVKLIYKYLETKLRNATVIEEYRQVTDAYNNLFLVDPIRDWCDEKYNDINNLLEEEYEISSSDLYALYNYFAPDSTDFSVLFNGTVYPISLYNVLNNDALDVEISGKKMFREVGFLDVFTTTLMDSSFVAYIKDVDDFSDNVKLHYKEIIRDKVTFDVNSTDAGPITFDALLHRTNSTLYNYMHTLKNSDNQESIIMFMRAIVKSLESYTNSSLSALEFRALGVENYVKILKEVISYFKSYMVEFTKDEFIYLFDGIFDNGGNSNMLKLMDEVAHLTLTLRPKDSMTLFDVGNFEVHFGTADNPTPGLFHDEAIFRMITSYAKLKSSGLDIWYDDGKSITKTPFSGLTDSTKIIANMVKKKNSDSYMIIIHKNNVNPDNYYGNKRKLR